jgi:hypothetical protein
MPFDMYGVVKIKNTNPEVFWIMLADSSMPKESASMQTSDDLDEKGVRDQLSKWGLSDTRIDELIAKARANPK